MAGRSRLDLPIIFHSMIHRTRINMDSSARVGRVRELSVRRKSRSVKIRLSAFGLLGVLVCALLCCCKALEYDLNLLSNTEGFIMGIAGSESASDAGDINGDGVGDILIGVPTQNNNAGVAYVVFGRHSATIPYISLTSFSTSATNGFRIFSAATGDLLGHAVSKAGDVNSDGWDDIIVGAYGADVAVGKEDAGVTYVIFGRKVATVAGNAFTDIYLTNAAFAPTVGFRILGALIGDWCGFSVSDAGDMNGDGIDDVIVSSVLADPPALVAPSNDGIAYVIFGKNMTGITTGFGDVDLSTVITGSTRGFRILSGGIYTNTGFSVSRAGDVNNDGISDVIVGAHLSDPTTSALDAGIVHIVFGRKVTSAANRFEDIIMSNTTMVSGAGFRIVGVAASDWTGFSVSGADDLNDDGIDDVIIGAVAAERSPSLSTTGMTYVIFGRDVAGGAPAFTDIYLATLAQGPSAIGFRIIGGFAYDESGCSVSAVGDINGDGIGDVIVGARLASPTPALPDAGIAYVIYGRSSPIIADIDLATIDTYSALGFRILGNTADSRTGYAVSGAGDVNGDGINDILVGSLQSSSFVTYGLHANPTSQPSGQPSRQPSRQPSSQPSSQPSNQPSQQPTRQPSSQPSQQPSTQPSAQPSRQPSTQPSRQPSRQPSTQPSCQPTTQPSSQPSSQPSQQPSGKPSAQPTRQPLAQPSSQPSNQPSLQPTQHPSSQPSEQPSGQPSGQPTGDPSRLPSTQPTIQPSCQPSCQPLSQPSTQPTARPSLQPTVTPSMQPSRQPTGHPSSTPSSMPSAQPSSQPSRQPSRQPLDQPSSQPTTSPSEQPRSMPSYQPSAQPSGVPTTQPSKQPSVQPSCMPTLQSTGLPSGQPTLKPLAFPSIQPSCQPSSQPSGRPTMQPSCLPTAQPSNDPTSQPSTQPSHVPASWPTVQPTAQPSRQPSYAPSVLPSARPSARPSRQPSSQPSCIPSY